MASKKTREETRANASGLTGPRWAPGTHYGLRCRKSDWSVNAAVRVQGLSTWRAGDQPGWLDPSRTCASLSKRLARGFDDKQKKPLGNWLASKQKLTRNYGADQESEKSASTSAFVSFSLRMMHYVVKRGRRTSRGNSPNDVFLPRCRYPWQRVSNLLTFQAQSLNQSAMTRKRELRLQQLFSYQNAQHVQRRDVKTSNAQLIALHRLVTASSGPDSDRNAGYS